MDAPKELYKVVKIVSGTGVEQVGADLLDLAFQRMKTDLLQAIGDEGLDECVFQISLRAVLVPKRGSSD